MATTTINADTLPPTEEITNEQTQSDVKNLKEIVSGFRTAMLVTHLNHEPNGRPMQIASQEGEVLWFITSRSSSKTVEIMEDAAALVTLQSSTSYAMLRGYAAVIDDDEKLESLWNPAMSAFFHDGATSKDAVLLRFRPTTGEYWDVGLATGLRFVASLVKALVTGDTVDTPDGSHGSVDLS